MIDQKVLDTLARLLGQRGRPIDGQPGQQKRELFAAVAGNQHGLFERDR